MTRLFRMLLVVLAGALVAELSRPAPAFGALKSPNLVVILADDLGYGDLGCFGQKTLQTPRLDVLRRPGVEGVPLVPAGLEDPGLREVPVSLAVEIPGEPGAKNIRAIPVGGTAAKLDGP